MPEFKFRDNQQVDIIGNNTFIIFGGQVEVTLKFTWIKNNSNSNVIEGNGTAAIVSDSLVLSKQFILNGSIFQYSLLNYEDVKWVGGKAQAFRISEIYPYS